MVLISRKSGGDGLWDPQKHGGRQAVSMDEPEGWGMLGEQRDQRSSVSRLCGLLAGVACG